MGHLSGRASADPGQGEEGDNLFNDFPVHRILGELAEDSLLPAILFRTSRKQCDNDIERLTGTRFCQLSDDEQRRIGAEVRDIIRKYSFDESVVCSHEHFEPLLRTGAGAHHAGQLLIWRLLLEELMSRGALRLMIATGTVAAGVDFPARTVVVTAHSKRGSEGFNVLTSAEFQQMAGRAGRRGKDSVGICLVAPSRFSDARIINEVSKKPPEPLRSAYFAAPSTVLNLLKFRNVDDLRYTVSRSLASFLDRKSARSIREEAQQQEVIIEEDRDLTVEARKRGQKRVRRSLREADILETRQETLLTEALDGLTRLGFIEQGGLTIKGSWAAELCTTYVLELAEAIEEGLFYDLGVVEVVGLAASIAGDAHRVYFSMRPNPVPKALYKKFSEIIDRVRETYFRPYVSELTVLPDAALTVLTWMECDNWDEFSSLLNLGGIAQGDVARLVTQTSDHLNQISKLTESHPELARMAFEGRKRILKPPLSEGLLSD